tara:strand:- start:670 stop:891 length:222 start_codon:yes stop_codon:yes gene_type:complete
MKKLKSYNVRSNLSVHEHGLIKRDQLVPFLIGAANEVRYRTGLDPNKEMVSYWMGQADGLEQLAAEINSLIQE